MNAIDTQILHADLNNFYASVECLYNPAIRSMPVAVCGDPDARHGIVLAKNQIAKGFGVITGQTIWQAKQLCPDLVIVKPNYELYLKFSKLAKEIYYSYTDQVENFGIDEAFMDVTGSILLFGSAEHIAQTIRKRIFAELGVTVSVGVSFSKVFAKLASDFRKPDAVTIFSRENYKTKVWPLHAQNLLYVGRSTGRKLAGYGINTIGDLANFDVKLLYNLFGKVGVILHQYANGIDNSKVARNDASGIIKSIGNSTTPPRDLTTAEDIWLVFNMLAESVASRLRDNGLKCRTVQIYLRDNDLFTCERQSKTETPTCLSSEIAKYAMKLFRTKYSFQKPLRSLGIRACDLQAADETVQLSLLYDYEKQRKLEKLEETVDVIRSRFGHFSIQKGIVITDKQLGSHNPKNHKIYPAAGVCH